MERERRRVVGRNDWDVAVEVSPSPAYSNLSTRTEKSRHSGDSEGDDHPRLDQRYLGFEIVPAGRNLGRIGCPVGQRVTHTLFGRAALDDVGDVSTPSVQPSFGQKAVKLLAGGPDEWHTFGVFFRPGSLADDHEIGPDVSVTVNAPEDDLVTSACERATLAALRAHPYRCEFHEHHPLRPMTLGLRTLSSCHRGRVLRICRRSEAAPGAEGLSGLPSDGQGRCDDAAIVTCEATSARKPEPA